jgi:hypothetical protein
VQANNKQRLVFELTVARFGTLGASANQAMSEKVPFAEMIHMVIGEIRLRLPRVNPAAECEHVHGVQRLYSP